MANPIQLDLNDPAWAWYWDYSYQITGEMRDALSVMVDAAMETNRKKTSVSGQKLDALRQEAKERIELAALVFLEGRNALPQNSELRNALIRSGHKFTAAVGPMPDDRIEKYEHNKRTAYANALALSEERAAIVAASGATSKHSAPEMRHFWAALVHCAALWECLGGRAHIPKTGSRENIKPSPFERWFKRFLVAVGAIGDEIPHRDSWARCLSGYRKSQFD